MDNNTSKVMISMLCERARNFRLEYPMTQKQLAEKSGVSLRSIQAFEAGGDIQVSNLIKILNALELSGNLLMLIPDVTKRPSMYLEKERTRKRARVKCKGGKEQKGVFVWGDEK